VLEIDTKRKTELAGEIKCERCPRELNTMDRCQEEPEQNHSQKSEAVSE
jgi:hypothetical protein